jgi:hypothetical protein
LNPVALVGYSLGQGATMQDTSVKKKVSLSKKTPKTSPKNKKKSRESK